MFVETEKGDMIAMRTVKRISQWGLNVCPDFIVYTDDGCEYRVAHAAMKKALEKLKQQK